MVPTPLAFIINLMSWALDWSMFLSLPKHVNQVNHKDQDHNSGVASLQSLPPYSRKLCKSTVFVKTHCSVLWWDAGELENAALTILAA